MGRSKGSSRSRQKSRDKTKLKADRKRQEQELMEKLDNASEWAKEALLDALLPIVDEMQDRDNPYEIGVFGPTLMMFGVTFALDAVGEEETLLVLKDLIKGVKSGELQSYFDLDEDESEDEEENLPVGDDSDEEIPF